MNSQTITGWQDHRVCLISGPYESNLDTGADYDTITLGELIQRVRKPLKVAKDKAPLFLPSAYCDYDARSHTAQREKGRYVALVADLDEGEPKEKVTAALDAIIPGLVSIMYATRSSTATKPKWRVIVPLKRPMPFDNWDAAQSALARLLDDHSIKSDATARRAAQMQYLPNQGEHYELCIRNPEGEALSKHSEAPIIPAIRDEWVQRQKDEAEREKAREQARARAQLRRESANGSPVEHYNANTAIKTLLAAHGFENRAGTDDWSWEQGSGTYSLRDYGDHWVYLGKSFADHGIGSTSAASGASFGDAFDLFVHFEFRGDFAAAVAAVGHMMRGEEIREKRREAQKERNRAIGDDVDIESCRIGTIDLEYALVNFAFITDGRRVVDLTYPRVTLTIEEARLTYKASKVVIEIGGKEKAVSILSLWEANEERLTVAGTTFLAGGSAITLDPAGARCVNTWVPPVRFEPPSDWAERAQIFVEHINWLFADDAELFLDWLAHIEQRPGVLPSTGWLHIAKKQGLGRNWISSVAARVWRGYVASGFDLGGMLSNGFNGALSRKLLVTVDEIDAGLATYQSAQVLKQAITETYRNINPKYGRQSVEHNAARWLIFSNSATALPLEKNDRRFHVVRCDDDPKDTDYYDRLYEVLDCPKFLASVAHLLGTRNIRRFKPGAPARMSRSKADMIEALMPEAEQEMQRVIDNWPRDLISKGELLDQIGDIQPKYFKRLCAQLGVVSLGRREFGKEVREQRPVSGSDKWATKLQIYAIRNTEKWRAAFENDRELINEEWVKMADGGGWIEDENL